MADKKLYPHNQKAFDETLKMLETVNKVAIVQATGSGKGFLAAEFIKGPFKGKNILVLAPGKGILTNYEKSLNVKEKNVQFSTYANIMKKYQAYKEGKEDFFEKFANSIDLLVLDEFHRVGADKWGEAVLDLIEVIESRSNKVIGLSATPVRYLDNFRDMVDEVFCGNVVQGVTLEEAIIQGILPSFKYIISVYGYSDEVNNLEKQVKRMRASNRDKYTEGLDRAEEAINRLKLQIDENAILKETIQTEIKHLEGPQKWIVFCNGVEELKEVNEHLSYWFAKPINKYKPMGWNPHNDMLNIFTVYTDSTEKGRDALNQKNLDAFYDVNKGISIMTCINKLNEGTHVEGITGVLMLRRTISPTIYLQQIGRALSAGSTHKPIIFDFINNYNNLKRAKLEAGFLGIQEIKRKVDVHLADPSTKEKVEKIVLKNKAQDIEKLFGLLEELVIPNTRWSEYELAILHEYYPIRGAVEVRRKLPKRTEDAIDGKAKEQGLVYNPGKYEVKENTGSNLLWTDYENNLILQYFKAYFETGRKDRNSCANDLKLYHLQHRKLYQIIDQYERLTGKQRYKIRGGKKYENEGKRWTNNDIRYLRDCYIDKTPMEMMILVLERSEGAILNKARLLGLTGREKTSRPWTEKEFKFLITNIEKPSKEIAEVLGRTEQAVNHQKKRVRDEMGIKQEIERRKTKETTRRKDNWTIVEENMLDMYMDNGIEKLKEVLPHREEKEIRSKVQDLCMEWGCPNPLLAS